MHTNRDNAYVKPYAGQTMRLYASYSRCYTVTFRCYRALTCFTRSAMVAAYILSFGGEKQYIDKYSFAQQKNYIHSASFLRFYPTPRCKTTDTGNLCYIQGERDEEDRIRVDPHRTRRYPVA